MGQVSWGLRLGRVDWAQFLAEQACQDRHVSVCPRLSSQQLGPEGPCPGLQERWAPTTGGPAPARPQAQSDGALGFHLSLGTWRRKERQQLIVQGGWFVQLKFR